jgi:hypothetical protein
MIRRRLYGDRGESRVKIPTRTRALFLERTRVQVSQLAGVFLP